MSRLTDRHSADYQDEAVLLVRCAELRCPLEEDPFMTLVQLIKDGRAQQIADRFTVSKYWNADRGQSLKELMDALRSDLKKRQVDAVSDDILWQVATDATISIGTHLIETERSQVGVVEIAAEVYLSMIDEVVTAAMQEVTVLLPISNLYIDQATGEIKLGQVTLQRESLGEFLSPLGSSEVFGEYTQKIIDQHQLRDEKQRKYWASQFQTIHSSAKIVIPQGDDYYALNHAYHLLEEALAIVRVIDERYGYWSGRTGPPVPGAVPFVPRMFYPKGMEVGGAVSIFSTHRTGTTSFDPEHDVRNVFNTLRTDLTQPVQVQFSDWKSKSRILDALSSTLMTSTKLRLGIGRSVQIFDESIRLHSPSAAFLGLMNSVEVLIGGDYSDWNDSISNRVSERPAFLLADPEPRSRQRIAKQIKELYRVRSAITHAGKEVSAGQIRAVEYLARKLILWLAVESEERNWQSPIHFYEWVRDLKFGCPYQSIGSKDLERYDPDVFDRLIGSR